MRKLLTSRYTRLTAWVLMLATTTFTIPVDAFASPRKLDAAQGRHSYQAKMQVRKTIPRPDVRELLDREMSGIFGRGPYRNAYLCGTMPWHRSFRDLNLCTGNVFKSFTDIQVAPAQGAGLVLQRSYNSNDDRIGPFGRGWTHAYEIRMEEIASVPDPNDPDAIETAVRTDFLGGKHKYTRDADGLYTPPPYMHDWTKSDYKAVLETGPGDVNSDVEIGLDGTTKHFVAQGNVRVCDYIEDRHGNRTTLDYDSGTGLLDTVTDPSGRVLQFTWTNYGTQQNPIWRITQVTGPLQTVTYSYYLPGQNGCGGEGYNLKSVTLDPGGLNRTTTYAYTTITGSQGTELGLLASVTDPLGNTVAYNYDLDMVDETMGGGNITGTVWVNEISEPGGVDANGDPRTLRWGIVTEPPGGGFIILNWVRVWDKTTFPDGPLYGGLIYSSCDDKLRTIEVGLLGAGWYPTYACHYDDSNNVIITEKPIPGLYGDETSGEFTTVMRVDHYTYGRHGNVLTHWIGPDPKPASGPFSGQETYAYYTEDNYFQKKSFTDMAGHVTTFGYGSRYDSNTGNRGNLLWIRDARHQPDGTEVAYAYNEYGQKISETNLNGVVTEYHYGDQWGNCTQVVQDVGQGHLNRTTDLVYDMAGRVTSRTDPNRRTSTVDYNNAGQPETAFFPATSNTPAETISYTYEANGRIESVTDNRGTTTLEYEQGCDRVSSVTDPVTGTISYKYTILGSLESMSMPGGGSWTYTYEGIDGFEGMWDTFLTVDGALQKEDDPNSYRDNLHEIKDETGRVLCHRTSRNTEEFNRCYDESGELTSFCETVCQYDQLSNPEFYCDSHNWLRRVQTRFYWKDAQGQWQWDQPKLLSKNEYTYDSLGNRLTNAITLRDVNDQLTTRTETYGYDELSRLASVNYGDGGTQSYTFDDMGNRLTQVGTTYGYNAANMLTTVDGQPYANYDANGNQLAGGGRTNIWDSRNRLAQCVYDATTSNFVYGSDGLRHRSTVNSVATDFVFDGQNMIRELRSGTPYATYLNGPRGIEFRRDDATGQVRWYLYDGLGSVVGELAESTATDVSVTATRKLAVYGSVRGSTGSSASNHKFVGSLGHMSEDDTGLIYMRARYMDPITGQFISEDPAKDGQNWYVYAGNNPVNLADRTGMFLDLLLGELIGLEEEGSEGAVAQGVKQWGTDKIYQAVARYSGMITGYLLAGELTSRVVPKGIIIRNSGAERQIFIDFAGDHFGGQVHIDFQPDYIGGVKYTRIFLEGLVQGLTGL